MNFSLDLLEQADHLATRENRRPRQASLRRAVSDAYYALFHALTFEAATLIASNAKPEVIVLIQRWFDHSSIYNACAIFAGSTLAGPLARLAGATPLPDLQLVARAFRELQQARHSADYDMTSSWTRLEVQQHIRLARDAYSALRRARRQPQANVFALTLLDAKRVQSER